MTKRLSLFLVLVCFNAASSMEAFINEWVIHIPSGAEAAAAFAKENGFLSLGEVLPGSNEFHMKHHRSRSKRAATPDHSVQKRILQHKDVEWAEQQTAKVRIKRDDFPSQHPARSVRLNDPYWNKMWYLNRGEDLDMNVEGAWREGVTGKGISVTILDDGIEKDHPDLISNYDPLSSTDINDNDSDPHPRYDYTDSNRHGTRCAGQVAASPNNSLCAVGIAFNAQIGGIRMLDGQVSDAVEARSLGFNPDHIDIYSSSWGPNDDGKTVDGPGKLAARAFKNGITRGRDGKGSIFVWASGNGGRYKDNCNCDGYATSIYTITVSSTSESGQIPWYSEACSSTLATTYSSGTNAERQIVTTDLHHGCTMKHTGTSASAPMAAGIIALTLEANPSLTWRDVQHIIIRTARPANLKAPDWKSNGLRRKVSHSYGYGLMDTTAMVKLSKKWTLVPPQRKCVVSATNSYQVIPSMNSVSLQLQVTDCPYINALEHVVCPIKVTPGRKRGDLRIYLTSPAGTRSTLLDARPQDYSTSGFLDWPFMTVHSWGEDPRGTWFLEVHNDAYSKWPSDAKLLSWSLELYGIEFDPNSDEYKKAHQERFNYVREVPDDLKDPWHVETPQRATKSTTTQLRKSVAMSTLTPNKTSGVVPQLARNSSSVGTFQPSPTWSTGASPSSTATPPKERPTRGCIGKQGHCTKDAKDCRTFSHRSVSGVFCKCTPDCLDIGTVYNPVSDTSSYNMQCHPQSKYESHEDHRRSIASSKLPLYCQFIPFFVY